jgi:hypothetical protein
VSFSEIGKKATPLHGLRAFFDRESFKNKGHFNKRTSKSATLKN